MLVLAVLKIGVYLSTAFSNAASQKPHRFLSHTVARCPDGASGIVGSPTGALPALTVAAMTVSAALQPRSLVQTGIQAPH